MSYLFAFLKGLITITANETIDVINIIVLNSHHHLIGINFLATTITFCSVDSILNGKLFKILIQVKFFKSNNFNQIIKNNNK